LVQNLALAMVDAPHLVQNRDAEGTPLGCTLVAAPIGCSFSGFVGTGKSRSDIRQSGHFAKAIAVSHSLSASEK
jgi:hypothetical protein